jgi:hypothetical protein
MGTRSGLDGSSVIGGTGTGGINQIKINQGIKDINEVKFEKNVYATEVTWSEREAQNIHSGCSSPYVCKPWLIRHKENMASYICKSSVKLSD